MKRILIIAIILGLSLTAYTQTKKNKPVKEKQTKEAKQLLNDKKSKLSYSIGLSIGKQVKMQNEDFAIDLLLRGIKDAMEKDSNYLLSDEQIQQVFKEYQEEKTAMMNEEKKAKGAINKLEEQKYLEENKKKEGVITLENGLQYRVLKSGDGPNPADTSRVKVHYEGKLTDGKVFDSSIKRGEPANFPLKGLIKGWQIALKLMKVGDKWELTIPSELAYGENGAGDMIGPNAVLVFDIELLGIE